LGGIRRGATVLGVDGCHGGWLAVISRPALPVIARVYGSFAELIASVDSTARIGVDIPMGLPDHGARACELEARQRLGRARKSSDFPAPPRQCLTAQSYEEACQLRFRIEGKKMSRQAYGILPKIREVDGYLTRHPETRRRIAEVHPEVSFAAWCGGNGMSHSKKSAAGKAERGVLISKEWPGAVERLRVALRGQDYVLDDLHDAFAALWSTNRWLSGKGVFLGGRERGKRHRSTAEILV